MTIIDYKRLLVLHSLGLESDPLIVMLYNYLEEEYTDLQVFDGGDIMYYGKSRIDLRFESFKDDITIYYTNTPIELLENIEPLSELITDFIYSKYYK